MTSKIDAYINFWQYFNRLPKWRTKQKYVECLPQRAIALSNTLSGVWKSVWTPHPFKSAVIINVFVFVLFFFCRISVVVFPFEVVQIQRVTDFIELSHNESLFNEIEHPFFSANHYLSPNEVLDWHMKLPSLLKFVSMQKRLQPTTFHKSLF